jgi:DeoR/GlpR family transcriptional regulator of sugar metabolism
MLAEERRSKILEVVNARGSVSVNDLHRSLDVSQETIRRDITKLSSDGRLRKTHGGALALDHAEPIFEERMAVNIEGKRAIGKIAADMVTDDCSVLIDSGTTTLCLAEFLVERRKLTIYTNDMHIAQRLSGRNENRVLLTGGEVLASEGALLGRDATVMLNNYYPDFAFVGVTAMASNPWLMDYTREAAELRTQMLSQARTKVLLADHSKFERTAPVQVSGLETVDIIITDIPLSEKMQAGLSKLPAEIRVASEETPSA